MNASDLTKQIADHVEELARLTDDARKAASMQTYLNTLARFHAYSANNTLLIFIQNPNATQVAGYKAWQKFNRQVRRGEHGIAILAPVRVPAEAEGEGSKYKLYFKTTYVFDVAQTDGEPLPAVPEWRSLERDQQLANRLIAFAGRLGISVSIENTIAQGTSSGGAITVREDAGTKTIAHELAHELLHGDLERMTMTREQRELEAEAVAYVVARHFEIGGLNSPNYLALWSADAGAIRARLDRIQKCARKIIEGCNPDQSAATEPAE